MVERKRGDDVLQARAVGATPEIFGRADELQLVRDAFSNTDPAPAVLVAGPAGIGKTALFDVALATLPGDGWRVLAARPGEAEARMSLLGLHDLLHPILDEVLPTLPQSNRADLVAALGLRSTDGVVDEGRLALAVAAVLRALAQAGPTAIGIDDIGWLDRSSAALLESALRRTRTERIGVVATRRTPGPTPPVALGRIFGAALVRVDLAPLTLGAIHRMILTRLGTSLARPAVVRVHEASGGNPLYALEFARALARSSRPEAFDASVPEDVGALLWRRAARLSPLARELVLVAALATRPTTAVAAAVVDRQPAEVEIALAEAVDAGLLRDDDDGLHLGHPLVGSVVRHRTLASHRRALHRRLAAIVENEDEAALHLGLAAQGLDETAAAALEASARRSFARGAPIDALERFARSIRLTPDGGADAVARRRVGLAEAAIVAGDTERAVAELDGLDIALVKDPELRGDAALVASAVAWLAAHGEAASRELLERLAVDESIPAKSRARIHLRLVLMYEFDRRRGAQHVRAALDLIDPTASPGDYGGALMSLAATRLHLGETADHEAMRLGADLQASDERWDASTLPLNWAIWMDDWQTARRLIERERRAAEATGDETMIEYVLTSLAEVEAWSGHLDAALAAAEAAVERAESTRQSGRLRSALIRRGLVRALRGDLGDALADGEQVLKTLDAHPSTTLRGHALAVLGAVAIGRDDPASAERELSRAIGALDDSGDVDQPNHRFHADLLDALVGLGDLGRARLLVDQIARSGELGPRPGRTAIAHRGRALIAMAEGRLDTARVELEAAIAAHRLTEVPIEDARTLVVLGQLERRSGRRRAAAQAFQEAEEHFDRIGARGWATRASRELERLGTHRGPAESLTPSERRIASLAASGLRNHEIAARLLISPKTVEANLSRAYAKLGVRSRTELGAALAVGLPESRPSS